MCAPSAPAAPDYKGAAEAEGKSKMSSTYTPFGSSVYSADPTSPSGYRQDVSLDPNIQKATDAMLPRIAEHYSTPLDVSGVDDVYNKAYGAQTSRLDPYWGQQEKMRETALANQGIGVGSEAYSNAMRDFGQQRNDAYQQAQLAAIGTMPQTYDLAERSYAQPLNVLNALRSGQQTGGSANGPGVDYLKALQGQSAWNQGLYNADMGAYNAQLGGAAALGGSYLYGLAAGSDRRLKSNIVRIGTHELGFGIYEYDIDYEGQRHEIGVMADEVEKVIPQAVITGPDGYKRVFYHLLV